MNKFDLDFKKAKRKGHNMVLVFNHYANCICIFDTRKPFKPSQRLSLLDESYQHDDFHDGVSLQSIQNFTDRDKLNVVIDTWRSK